MNFFLKSSIVIVAFALFVVSAIAGVPPFVIGVAGTIAFGSIYSMFKES